MNNIGFREFELEWGYSWRKVLYVCVCCKNCIFCRCKKYICFLYLFDSVKLWIYGLKYIRYIIMGKIDIK